jgi:FkbM family methyltransferase
MSSQIQPVVIKSPFKFERVGEIWSLNKTVALASYIKRGVLYVFNVDALKGNFLGDLHKFPEWEEYTFDVFEYVVRNLREDERDLVIDIGAWIGTTAVWLSAHFKSVFAIEGDMESCNFFKQTVVFSGCKNVRIVDRPIGHEEKEVIFGPRIGMGRCLNQSTSRIKTVIDSPFDYRAKTITFAGVMNEVENVLHLKVSFVKCDIEGGEEDIIEDVLTNAFKKKFCVYISFHVKWWKNEDVSRFGELFSKFTIREFEIEKRKGKSQGKVLSNPILSLIQNPFESLLFEIPKIDFSEDLPALEKNENLV